MQHAVTGGAFGRAANEIGRHRGRFKGPLQRNSRGVEEQQRIILLSTSTHATSSFCAVLTPTFSFLSLLLILSCVCYPGLYSLYPTYKHNPTLLLQIHPDLPPLKMAARPQNIGIKAIEIYFPSQVRTCSQELLSGPRTSLLLMVLPKSQICAPRKPAL